MDAASRVYGAVLRGPRTRLHPPHAAPFHGIRTRVLPDAARPWTGRLGASEKLAIALGHEDRGEVARASGTFCIYYGTNCE